MDLIRLFKSISLECEALKDRVRYLIDDGHWPTDGAWKESVLRTMIRRTAPETITVGRGFVLSHDRQSTEIDILIYDSSYPVLYKEGDLVFISPAACKGIVEVKSRLTPATLRTASSKLADVAEFIRTNHRGPVFVGLFSYEFAGAQVDILPLLKEASEGEASRVIDHVVLGEGTFVKYWRRNPQDRVGDYGMWHQYMMHGLSAGYFIHSLVTSMAPTLTLGDGNNYFPREGKELNCVGRLKLVEDDNEDRPRARRRRTVK